MPPMRCFCRGFIVSLTMCLLAAIFTASGWRFLISTPVMRRQKSRRFMGCNTSCLTDRREACFGINITWLIFSIMRRTGRIWWGLEQWILIRSDLGALAASAKRCSDKAQSFSVKDRERVRPTARLPSTCPLGRVLAISTILIFQHTSCAILRYSSARIDSVDRLPGSCPSHSAMAGCRQPRRNVPRIKGENVNRRMGVAILAVVALVLVLSSAGQAQAQGFPTLTRHVREVTVNGEAPQMGKLPAGQSMRLVLTLPLRNQTQLDEFLKNLYDPSSAYFHQFLTVEEFTSLFGPTQADYNTVIHFAEANGLAVVGTSRNRLNVDVSGSVGAIQKALNITLGVYQ